MVQVVLTLVWTALFFEAQVTEIIAGISHVVDSGTLEVGAQKVQLAGIDAPETDRVCLSVLMRAKSGGVGRLRGRHGLGWQRRHFRACQRERFQVRSWNCSVAPL
jgi:hypothetical protein